MSIDEKTIISKINTGLEGDQSKEPYLIIIAGSDIGKLYRLPSDELIAGRSPDCDIWIEDSTISRKHFKIRKTNKGYMIEDLNSTNGTFLNNKRIQSAVLTESDKIQISKDTIMQFDFFDEGRKISEQKRYEMGVKDAVTGTFNKSYFLQRINDEFSFCERQNLPLTVVMFDIDYFKMINDSHGHLAGDQVLKEICSIVSTMIRKEDVFCRYGGEEFVIVMRNAECQHAVNLAERIRRKIEGTPVVYEGQKINVTISLGVSTFVDQNFKDYVALISDADKYLYKSKGNGRNKVSACCLPQI